MKNKPVQEAEFQVVSHKLDKNKHAVFTCSSPGGNFSVKCKGTAEQRLAMASHAEDYYGKWLTVEYEMLSKDGKPLKPVGLTFRLCDPSGEPLE